MEASDSSEDAAAVLAELEPVDWAQLRLLARLSPGERVRSGMQAHAFAVAGLRATFRRRFPDLSPAEINMKVLAYLTPVRLPPSKESE